MNLTLRLSTITALRDLPSRRSPPHTAALRTLAIPNYGVFASRVIFYTLPKLFICLLFISTISPYAFTTSNDSKRLAHDLLISCPSLYHTDNSRSCRRMRLALRQRHLKRDLLSFNTARSYFKVCGGHISTCSLTELIGRKLRS